MIKLECPIYVKVGRKNISLSYNAVKNLNHHAYNNLKKAFTSIVDYDLTTLTKYNQKINLLYVVHPSTKAKIDNMNFGSTVSKFLLDALESKGIIQDDNSELVDIELVTSSFIVKGGVCEVYISTDVTELFNKTLEIKDYGNKS